MAAVNRQNRDSRVPEALKILYGVLQRRVRWTRMVEQVACDYHEVGFQLDGFVHEFGESVVEVLPSRL
jgi:hypothetical protein